MPTIPLHRMRLSCPILALVAKLGQELHQESSTALLCIRCDKYIPHVSCEHIFCLVGDSALQALRPWLSWLGSSLFLRPSRPFQL